MYQLNWGNKIQKFVKKVDNDANTDQKVWNKETGILNDRKTTTLQPSIVIKRPVDQSLSPAVKFIHQNSDLYYKYQDLWLYYEEARNKVQFKRLKQFIDIK